MEEIAVTIEPRIAPAAPPIAARASCAREVAALALGQRSQGAESFEYEELIDAGDTVVAILSQRVRGRTSGVELEWKSYGQVWTIRDAKKIVRVEFFPTRGEAHEAVGLPE